MKNIFLKTLAIFASTLIFLASCQKDEIPAESAVEAPAAQEEACGTLVSATKVSTVPVTEMTESLIPTLKDSKEILCVRMIGKELVNFSIVTYKIRYRSKTVVAGKDTSIVLAGNVAYLVDKAGNINRHLESVTLYNSFFNTSSQDISLGEEYSYYFLRAIFNALVVFPLYQGGDVEEKDPLFVPSSEFIIKAKQAIDCELAALEFIKHQDGVEMLPNFYTENVGISNGGGPALAVQYLLENDPEYSSAAETVNLLSTYIGSGNCSSTSLISSIMHIDPTSPVNFLSTAGFIPTVVGTYLTWGNKYFKGLDVNGYFSEELLNTRFPDYGNLNAVELYSTNTGSMIYLRNYLPPINETINPDLLNEDKTEIDMNNPMLLALCNAFKENEVICHDWSPKHALRFVHSKNDDFIFYENVEKIWKELSCNGHNCLVRLDSIKDKDHSTAASQSMLDIILFKHPYYATSVIDIETLGDLF